MHNSIIITFNSKQNFFKIIVFYGINYKLFNRCLLFERNNFGLFKSANNPGSKSLVQA